MNEVLAIVIQAASSLALFKIAIDLGRVLQKIESHEKRLDRIEDNFQIPSIKNN